MDVLQVIKHPKAVRWNNKPVCPYCRPDKTSKHKYGHQCQKCQKSFSVTVGTIFHDTKIPFQTCFLAIAMFMDAKKGISAKQIERNLNVTYPTAWRMLHQIRKAMGSSLRAPLKWAESMGWLLPTLRIFSQLGLLL